MGRYICKFDTNGNATHLQASFVPSHAPILIPTEYRPNHPVVLPPLVGAYSGAPLRSQPTPLDHFSRPECDHRTGAHFEHADLQQRYNVAGRLANLPPVPDALLRVELCRLGKDRGICPHFSADDTGESQRNGTDRRFFSSVMAAQKDNRSQKTCPTWLS